MTPLKFMKSIAIQRIDQRGKDLPSVPGYQSGLWSIHKCPVMGQWIVSVQGIRCMATYHLKNAKAAASDFAAADVNWAAPRDELMARFRNDRKLSNQMIEILHKHSSATGR